MDLFGEESDLELSTSISNLYLGTQGWSYPSWVGPFYPEGKKAGEFISEYAKHFPTVEIDSTFYATPKLSLVDHWNRNTPERFIFSAKFPKQITHEKRLVNCEKELDLFLESMGHLNGKLGPLVLQFDYTFRADQIEVLADFVERLPKKFRYAVEVRHRGWLKEEKFFDILSHHQVALVLADLYYMPKLDKMTTDFVYIRWLGNRKDVPDDQYEKIILDKTQELLHWSGVVKGFLDKNLRVFGYFNNHFMGHSPGSIRVFLEMMRKRIRDGEIQ